MSNKKPKKKKQSAKKRQQKPQKLPKATTARFSKKTSKLLKAGWGGITILSLLYNFWISSFTLLPNVSILYSTNIPVKNNFALPLQIKNNSIFSITNTVIVINNNLVATFGMSFENMVTHNHLASKILPGESKDYIHDNEESFTHIPTKGFIKVSVSFEYTFFNIPYIISKTFRPYLDKNNQVRWLSN